MAPKALLGSKAGKVAGHWRSVSLWMADKQKGHAEGSARSHDVQSDLH